ncbi:NAD-dependent epimerase/dehydratase family protein [Paludisphaera rhizosphaerae]|uniref:NAD-dependent epimerase/dehydratase family protein n=1 Tax=Paludisphaera rhizosphaerae TaxID=2711216 RepID=UPI0013EB7795|nr:NAD-dependent epimerase/dehydratase family protein [Paludisphaera rhizosphaerae]
MTLDPSRPVLVTGGGGFLGSAIVAMLRERGLPVRSLSRNRYDRLDELGAEQVQGDVAEAATVDRAVEGCQAVFHVAAKAGLWGPREEYYRANVVGTENVLAACRKSGVRKLIHTSSPSVVFHGTDLEGVDESAPYADHYEAAYPETKAISERSVLKANDATLATVVLRPHLIWGPGDNNILPRIYARARANRLFRIGRRNPLIDLTYIDNAAAAHLMAADRLDVGATVAGKVYFIAQGEPVPVWDMVDRFLAIAHLPPVKRTVPKAAAVAIGRALEAVYRTFRLPGEPRMTRFLAHELSTAHWYNLDAARRDLGYTPHVGIEEGLRRLAASLDAPSPAS